MQNNTDNQPWPPPPNSVAAQKGIEPVLPAWVRWLGFVLILCASLTALYQWSLALYRFGLFLFDYGGRLGVNHADDFSGIYTLDAWAVPISLIAMGVLWRQSRVGKRLSVCVLLVNLLGAVAFFVMHQTGVLVTYNEYEGR